LFQKKDKTKNNNTAAGTARSKVWGVSNLGKVVNKYDGWGMKKARKQKR